MKDEQGKSKGFGFVNFNLHEGAKKAMEVLNGQLIGSKNLFVCRAQKKAEREETLRRMHENKCTDQCMEYSKDSNLYVTNLDVSIDDRKLKELFSAHGKITSAKVIRHGDETSKGFGFVCFSCPDEAKKALHSLNGTSVQGRTLHVALARQRELRSREFQKSSASFAQPLYTDNWNILSHKFQPPRCNFPYFYSSIPIQKWSPWNPGLYQNFDRPSDSFYPHEAMNFPEIFLTCPVQFTTFNGSKQDQDAKTRTHQIPSRRSQYKINNGDEVKSCKGSGTVNSFIMRSSPEVHKKRPGYIHPNFSARSSLEMNEESPGFMNSSLVQKFQPGLRLEMTKSDTQKLLNSPKSLAMQVEKAVQVHY